MFQVQNQLTWGQGRTCPWARSSGAPPEPPAGPRAAVPDGPRPPARRLSPQGSLPRARRPSGWGAWLRPPWPLRRCLPPPPWPSPARASWLTARTHLD